MGVDRGNSMIFSRETMKVGGKIAIPDSHISTEEGEIIDVANVGITVKYRGHYDQIGFYSFDWLNQQYGGDRLSPSKISPPYDDPIPF